VREEIALRVSFDAIMKAEMPAAQRTVFKLFEACNTRIMRFAHIIRVGIMLLEAALLITIKAYSDERRREVL